MVKESGMGMTVTIDNPAGAGKDISNDITSLSFGTPRGVQDVTGLDKAALERILLLADGTVSLSGVYNDTADKSHDVFKDVSTTSVARTVVILVSGQQLAMEILFTDYVLNRANDGSLVWTASGNLADGTAPAWTTP